MKKLMDSEIIPNYSSLLVNTQNLLDDKATKKILFLYTLKCHFSTIFQVLVIGTLEMKSLCVKDLPEVQTNKNTNKHRHTETQVAMSEKIRMMMMKGTKDYNLLHICHGQM